MGRETGIVCYSMADVVRGEERGRMRGNLILGHWDLLDWSTNIAAFLFPSSFYSGVPILSIDVHFAISLRLFTFPAFIWMAWTGWMDGWIGLYTFFNSSYLAGVGSK